MADEVGRLVARIEADSEKLRIGIEQANRSLDTLASSASRATQGFTNFQAGIVTFNQALELGRKAWDFFAEGARKVAEVVGQAIEQANAEDVAIAKLNAALQSTGQFSSAYSAALQDVAEKYSRLSTAGSEAILGVERLLVSFGAAPNQIEPLTKSVLDLSSGLRIDLESAASLVSKALAGNTEALGRYGIRIDETLPRQEQLKQLQEQIAARFGGQAAAELNTYAGAVAQAGKAYDDLLKAFGQVITSTPEARALFEAITQTLRSWTESINANKAEWIDWVGSGIRFAVHALEDFIAVGRRAVAVLEVLNIPADLLKIGAGAPLTPIADELAKLETEAGQFTASFEALAAKLKTEGPASAAGIQPITEEAKRAALEVSQIGSNLGKLPKEKNIDINIRQRLVGGGGGAGGAPIDTSGMSTDMLAQFQKGLRNSAGDLTAAGRQALGDIFTGFTAPPAVGGSITDLSGTMSGDFGTVTLGDMSAHKAIADADALISELRGGFDALSAHTFEGPILAPEIVMSPAVPFREGIEKMTALVNDFAVSAPALTFDASGLAATMNAWSARLGSSQMGELGGGFALLAQAASGTAPPIASLISQIAELRGQARSYQALSAMTPFRPFATLIPTRPGGDPSELIYPSYEDRGRAAASLAGKLEQLLNFLMAQQQEQRGVAADASRTAAATEQTAAAFRSSSFGVKVTADTTTTVRQTTFRRSGFLTGSR